MRRRASVFMLFAGQSLPGLVGICLVMALAQVGAFAWVATDCLAQGLPLTWAVDTAKLHYIFSVALFALLLMLYHRGLSGKSQTGYTILRLGVPLWQVGALSALNIALCLVIFWGVEVILVYGLGQWYLPQMAPLAWSHQSFALSCYRSPFLSSLLPLSNTWRWVRNGLMVVALALAGGTYGVSRWHSQGGFRVAGFMMGFAAVTFTSHPGSGWDSAFSIFYLVVSIWCLYLQLAHGEGGEPS